MLQEGSRAPLFTTSNSKEALVALYVTFPPDTNPNVASNAALAEHSMAWYSANVANLNFASPNSASTAAAVQEAGTTWELLMTRSLQVGESEKLQAAQILLGLQLGMFCSWMVICFSCYWARGLLVHY